MADQQGEQTARPRRGRPRKWPSEPARREHEAAKRRLRHKTSMTPEAFDDVVRLTALADDLQQRLDGSEKVVEQLRARTQELERRLTEAPRLDRLSRPPVAEMPDPTPPPKINRQQRREAERIRRRAAAHERRTAPAL